MRDSRREERRHVEYMYVHRVEYMHIHAAEETGRCRASPDSQQYQRNECGANVEQSDQALDQCTTRPAAVSLCVSLQCD